MKSVFVRIGAYSLLGAIGLGGIGAVQVANEASYESQMALARPVNSSGSGSTKAVLQNGSSISIYNVPADTMSDEAADLPSRTVVHVDGWPSQEIIDKCARGEIDEIQITNSSINGGSFTITCTGPNGEPLYPKVEQMKVFIKIILWHLERGLNRDGCASLETTPSDGCFDPTMVNNAIFNEYDLNGDGVLSKSELGKLLQDWGVDQGTRIFLYDVLDDEGFMSGGITPAELEEIFNIIINGQIIVDWSWDLFDFGIKVTIIRPAETTSAGDTGIEGTRMAPEE